MESKVFFLVMFAGIANAMLYQEKLTEIPAALSYEEGCYLKKHNLVLPFDSVLPEDGCSMIECTPHAVVYTSCDTPIITDPRCRIIDLKRGTLYPDYCLDVQCD